MKGGEPMSLLDKVLMRRPPIGDIDALADFLDEHAAFLVQKGIYEYSRARAGHYSKVLFQEAEFQQAADQSRWRAYPLGLAMVGELAEGVIGKLAGDHRLSTLGALAAVVLSVFDRHPVPARVGATDWSKARADLAQHLASIGLHPPKRAIDIPQSLAKEYFALMPIHKSLRGSDFPTVMNYLKVTLCNIHDELTKRTDARKVGELLRARTN